MGYTHYYKGQVNIDEALISDVKAIIKKSKIAICDGMGEGKPELVPGELIRFNGDMSKGEDYEGFEVKAEYNRDFCKTNRYPYDAVVTATLIRIAHLNDEFEVKSDGYWDSDWADGRELYKRTFGEEAVKPDSMP